MTTLFSKKLSNKIKDIPKSNFIRPHHSLGYKRPADIVYGV
jgi:hypothetical protein